MQTKVTIILQVEMPFNIPEEIVKEVEALRDKHQARVVFTNIKDMDNKRIGKVLSTETINHATQRMTDIQMKEVQEQAKKKDKDVDNPE